MGQCALHIFWTVPDDTTINDIDYFMIYVDEISALNKTSSNNDTLFSLPYVVRSCGPHNISVRILDQCGRMGQPSPTFTVNPELLYNDATCEGKRTVEMLTECKTAMIISLYTCLSSSLCLNSLDWLESCCWISYSLACVYSYWILLHPLVCVGHQAKEVEVNTTRRDTRGVQLLTIIVMCTLY